MGIIPLKSAQNLTSPCGLQSHARATAQPPLQSPFRPLDLLALSLQPHWSSLFFKHTKSILISNLYICSAFFFESISLIFLCGSHVPPSHRLSCLHFKCTLLPPPAASVTIKHWTFFFFFFFPVGFLPLRVVFGAKK